MQPTLQMSTGVEYVSQPNNISGGRYSRVTTYMMENGAFNGSLKHSMNLHERSEAVGKEIGDGLELKQLLLLLIVQFKIRTFERTGRQAVKD